MRTQHRAQASRLACGSKRGRCCTTSTSMPTGRDTSPSSAPTAPARSTLLRALAGLHRAERGHGRSSGPHAARRSFDAATLAPRDRLPAAGARRALAARGARASSRSAGCRTALRCRTSAADDARPIDRGARRDGRHGISPTARSRAVGRRARARAASRGRWRRSRALLLADEPDRRSRSGRTALALFARSCAGARAAARSSWHCTI